MTDEQKAALVARLAKGRAAAKELRDPTLPPEHLGQIPAGHERDEENRRRTDSLAEKAAETGGDAGGVDPDKFTHVDNEIAQFVDENTGDTPITKRNPNRHYVWVHADQVTTSAYNAAGYTAVQGKDPECEDFRGQHKAAGSSLRGWGDCLLFWCTHETRARQEERSRRKAIAMGAVEENWEVDANSGPLGRSYGPLAHGRPDDPKLRQTVLRGSQGEVAHLMDDFRTGKPIGNFKPGDDMRNR